MTTSHTGDLDAVRRELRRDDQNREAGADADQTEGELRRARRLARAEPHPQPREHRREHDDEQRLQRLELAARERPAEDRVRVARSANRFSVEPACSNTDQNKRGARKSARSRTAACARPGPVAAEKQPAEKDDRHDEERVRRRRRQSASA